MGPLDQITLTGVRAFGHHGVFADERREGQEFVVDVTLFVDTTQAAASDDVTDTVHYGEVAERIVELVGRDPLNLIEGVAARIADDLLEHPLAHTVRVTIHKPHAPITVPFGDVSVTIQRDAANRGAAA
ncbi:dihydroneopterin aldolase [Microbacterium kyungheense]|uniref:7,8-dihydroneopterin aldolase n=1 Tax=Microbacterium kyungheense TaxID=1263636 RepID=A0A543FIM9_9MICO|nr:dihydroneopterin aldolase [Microbacterium kyungheense]TQM33720.1 dihydroneopterin aldolase [Microbacterium kyungheense]